MRKIRRILTIMCTAVLVFTAAIPVLAEDGGICNVYINYVESTGEGPKLEIPVKSDGTATDGLTYITYDPESLQITKDDVSMEGAAMCSVNADTPGTLAVSWIAGEAPESGTLFEVSFDVIKNNAATGLNITGEAYSADYTGDAKTVGVVGMPEPESPEPEAPQPETPPIAETISSPNTGDTSPNIWMLFSIAAIGAAGTAVCLARFFKSGKKERKKIISFVLFFTLCFSLFGNEPVTVTAFAEEADPLPDGFRLRELKNIEDIEIADGNYRDDLGSYAGEMTELERMQDEIVPVIVMLEEPSVLERDSSAENDAATIAMSRTLENRQAVVIARIEQALGGQALEVTRQYTRLFNGFAASVRFGDISAIEEVDGVKSVAVQRVFHTTSVDAAADIMPVTNVDGPMIGREETWQSGYQGTGMKIAVIDTGLDINHKNFKAMSDDKLQNPTTMEDIEKILGAGVLHAQGNASELYHSNKIPFGYNYIDNEARVDHHDANGSEHGTHVAGIAAANDISDGGAPDVAPVVGVAPNAQIFVMKVFGNGDGTNTGAYEEDILAALEDALTLGVDVINMSLGSDAGFTSEGRTELDDVYARVSLTGTVLAASAGNSYSSGYENLWGTNANLASNPDNSVVGAPSTYGSALSVASVNNTATTAYYIEADGVKYLYSDTGGQEGAEPGIKSPNPPIIEIGDNFYGFAEVKNFGATLQDFEDANVKGKIALVSRGGGVNFSAKADNAAKAGAAACIVYNNAAGAFNMDLTACDPDHNIPCVSVTQAVGEALLGLLKTNPDAQIYVSKQIATIKTDDGYTMSEFSSWGVAPDLTLKPDIAAPGGNIYSTVADDKYGTMSGTSMAAPNISGITALVMQYVKQKHPDRLTATNHDFINSLLMSTAEPLVAGDGLYYSPRQQGAGLANADNAINTSVTLTVDGKDRPKIELLDDPGMTGVYSFTFKAENFGGHNAYYAPRTVVQTEKAVADDEGVIWMGMTPIAAEASAAEDSSSMIYTYDYDDNTKRNSHDAYLLYCAAHGSGVDNSELFRYDMTDSGDLAPDDVQVYLDELVQNDHDNVDLDDRVLRVKAGDTAKVDVSIQLSQGARDYMRTNFPNGIYVEGFTFLDPKPGTPVTLSIPYLGFYGDWNSAPTIDSAFYWDAWGMKDPDDVTTKPTGSQGVNALWAYFGNDGFLPLGLNAYLNEPFDSDHVSVSPNGDSYMDNIRVIWLSLLRNVGTLNVTYKDHVTGEVLNTTELNKISKTTGGSDGRYNTYSSILHPYSFDKIENGRKVDLVVSTSLDYYPKDGRNVISGSGSEWVTTITVDTQEPRIGSNVNLVEDNGQYILEMTITDEAGVSMLTFGSLNGKGFVPVQGFEEVPNGIYQMSENPEVKDKDGTLVYSVKSKKDPNTGAFTYHASFNITPLVDSLGEDLVLYMEDYASNTFATFLLEHQDPAFWEFTSTTDTNITLKSAVYREQSHLVYGIDDSNNLYAIQPDGSDQFKLSGDKDLKTRINEMTARRNSQSQNLGYPTDLEPESITVNAEGDLFVLAKNDSVSYIVEIDPRLDSGMIDEYPQMIRNAAANVTHLCALDAGQTNDFAFVYKDSGKTYLARFQYFGGGGASVIADLGDVDPVAIYFQGSAQRSFLYVAGSDGNLYRHDIGSSPTVTKVGEVDLEGHTFGGALCLYPQKPENGVLPTEQPVDPELEPVTFNYPGYRFAAAYDGIRNLIFAVDSSDNCLYALLPSEAENVEKRVKISAQPLHELMNLTADKGVIPITGLAVNGGNLYTFGRDLTKSSVTATLYEISLDSDTHVSSVKPTNFTDAQASSTAPYFIDGDTFLYVYTTDGHTYYLAQGKLSTGESTTLQELDFTVSAITYDSNTDWLYLNESEMGGLYAYPVKYGGKPVLIKQNGQYKGSKAMYPTQLPDGKLPDPITDKKPEEGEFTVTPLYVEKNSELKAAAYVEEDGLFYAIDGSNQLYAYLPEGTESVNLGSLSGVGDGLTLNSLASDGTKLYALASGDASSEAYTVNLETRTLETLFSYNGKAYVLASVGNGEFAFIDEQSKKIYKYSGSATEEWYEGNISAGVKTPFMVYGPNYPDNKKTTVEKLLYVWKGGTTSTISWIDPAYKQTKYSGTLPSKSFKVNTKQKLIGAYIGLGPIKVGELPQAAEEQPAPAVETRVYFFNETGWNVRALSDPAPAPDSFILPQGDTPVILGSVAYVPTNGLFYSICGDGLLRAFRPDNNGTPACVSRTPVAAQINGVSGAGAAVSDLACNPADGQAYALASDENGTYLALLDLESGTGTVTVTLDRSMAHLTFTSDGTAITSDGSGSVWRIGTDGSAELLAEGVFAGAIAWNASDRLIFIACTDGALRALAPDSKALTTVQDGGYENCRSLIVATKPLMSGELPAAPQQPSEDPAGQPETPLEDETAGAGEPEDDGGNEKETVETEQPEETGEEESREESEEESGKEESEEESREENGEEEISDGTLPDDSTADERGDPNSGGNPGEPGGESAEEEPEGEAGSFSDGDSSSDDSLPQGSETVDRPQPTAPNESEEPEEGNSSSEKP